MGMSENSSSPTNMVDVLTRANLQKIAQFMEKVAKKNYFGNCFAELPSLKLA
jgi:hypothetical protein